ncbi:MAG TPA: cyclomaltodextrinase N-terminal domain-containing protein, partial [Candidatus Eremiobacteraceae bacterium]|nr:cyclomaltodextrinase N-terminal domain-containing protein [Candidatus Eremiobacteraceae bacterium]
MFPFFHPGRIFERLFRLLAALSLFSGVANSQTASNTSPINAPVITKVEPPSWWLHLTPQLTLLLSGHNLESTEVSCNLPTLRVSRTQSSAKGNYLFVWLEISADTKSGTAVCRVTTPTGATSFELPIAARAPTLRRFQGVSAEDVSYLIMPDRFANGDPSNDEPAHTPGTPATHDRSNPRAWHGGDLRGILNHLP